MISVIVRNPGGGWCGSSVIFFTFTAVDGKDSKILGIASPVLSWSPWSYFCQWWQRWCCPWFLPLAALMPSLPQNPAPLIIVIINSPIDRRNTTDDNSPQPPSPLWCGVPHCLPPLSMFVPPILVIFALSQCVSRDPSSVLICWLGSPQWVDGGGICPHPLSVHCLKPMLSSSR